MLIRFLVNGSIFGALATIAYGLLEAALNFAGKELVISIFVYFLLIYLNFLSQKTIIFRQSGGFFRFIAVNVSVSICVSTLTQVLSVTEGLTSFWPPLPFVVSALVFSIPSFWLNKKCVFNRI